ncbi:MAG: GNAT family N-acetyltransferase [Clostridiales bacterium]|nr:GNAT family N-acetyltransferase [Clostridiales bacterium]
MELKLIEASEAIEDAYLEYISEWESLGEKIVPFASRREGKKFGEVRERWKSEGEAAAYQKGFVPASLYFLTDGDNRLYGAIHIRHELNEMLRYSGGHIGYGIKPSERKRGYASKMLSMALPLARKLGIERALLTCDKNNTGSAKTILKNGGVFESEIPLEDSIMQRYWIDIPSGDGL